MSAVLRLSRGKNKSFSTTAVAVVLGLFVVLFLVRYGQELLLEHELNDKAAAQRVANAQLRDQNARLRASLQYYQSTKYIEQRAREDLNLRRADEEVLIPANLEQATTGQSTLTVTKPGEPAQAPSNYKPSNAEQWFSLFAPAPPASSP